MSMPDKKEGDINLSPRNKPLQNTVWDIMRHTANDNTPPVFFWFYKVLILSLVVFGIIQLMSVFLKF